MSWNDLVVDINERIAYQFSLMDIQKLILRRNRFMVLTRPSFNIEAQFDNN